MHAETTRYAYLAMVNIKQLVASIGRVSWKAGNVQGKVEHVEPDGAHRIIVTIPENLAEWDAPHEVTGPTHFRDHPDLTWDNIKPPLRTPGKTKR